RGRLDLLTTIHGKDTRKCKGAALSSKTSSFHMHKKEFAFGFLTGGRRGDLVPLSHEQRVGRHESCEIQLDTDRDTAASRVHVLYKNAKNHPTLEDLGSRGGTFINGHPLRSKRPFALTPGDVIRLGRQGPMMVFSTIAKLQQKSTVALRVTHLDGFELQTWSFEASDSQHITAGRGPQNHISLPEIKDVSRRHFSLYCLFDKCILTDLGSVNGTYLRGQLVQSEVVTNGAVIEAGRSGPRFRVDLLNELDDDEKLHSLSQFSHDSDSAAHESWIDEDEALKTIISTSLPMTAKDFNKTGFDQNLKQIIQLNPKRVEFIKKLTDHDKELSKCVCTDLNNQLAHPYWKHRQDLLTELLERKECSLSQLPALEFDHSKGVVQDPNVEFNESDLVDIVNWYVASKAFHSLKRYNDTDRPIPTPNRAPTIFNPHITLSDLRPIRRRLIVIREHYARQIGRIRNLIDSLIIGLQSSGVYIDLFHLGELILQLSEATAKHKLIEELTGEVITDFTSQKKMMVDTRKVARNVVSTMDADEANFFLIGFHTGCLDVIEYNQQKETD
ncbi:MAG: FHA domain-containing protein, partial [Planctomycetota bacterium]|nr:FHA domain-containing protein [Planctomycetota bacterium]